MDANSKFEEGSSTTWIFGGVVFLLCLILAHALLEVVVNGPSGSINVLSLVGGVIYVPALVYFLVSMSIATMSFAGFCSHIIRRLRKIGTKIVFDYLEEKSERNEEKLEQVLDKELAKFSLDQFTVSSNFKNINARLKENRAKIGKMSETWEKHAKTMMKQANTLSQAEKRLEKIEFRISPKPCLLPTSDIEEISGVGEKTAQALRSIGIKKVEDLIIQDPPILAHKTQISENNITKIQASAQLLMIPGVNSETLKLLEKAGISSIEELASQKPMHLFKKVTNTAGKSKNRPTLEELALHIRLAQYYGTQVWGIQTVPIASLPKKIMRQ